MHFQYLFRIQSVTFLKKLKSVGQGFPNFSESRRPFSIKMFPWRPINIVYFGRAERGLLLLQIRIIYKIGSMVVSLSLSLSLSIYIYINIKKNWLFIVQKFNKKNTNLYKTIKNNLLKLNVSGEILPLSIVNFGEIWKIKLFSLMFRKQP